LAFDGLSLSVFQELNYGLKFFVKEKFLHRKIITTEDGSSSIYLPDLNEHYHSIHGAVQESKHVFIEMGWEKIQDSKFKIQDSGEIISILEVGFGTGLNAFLVLQECRKNNSVKVFYESLELYPISLDEAMNLNYAENEEQKNIFQKLHEAEWDKEIKIEENFQLKKNKIALEDFIPKVNTYDLIFFDTFSPEKQPELWTEEIFRKLYSGMKNEGILVTYCAKGQVRRNMIAAGFSVERLEGPPGKREMLRARKINN
jgi:tRNA U34 5-methylaminomethyl-2-thiouridine-forming methyltransferase MnmC